MNLSLGKCGSLLLCGNKNYNDEVSLRVCDTKLEIFADTNDLGVIIDSKLTFSKNIDEIISKANRKVYLIFKSFKTRSVKPLCIVFKTYS